MDTPSPSQTTRLLAHVQRHGIIRARDLDPLGIPRSTLKRLTDRGEIERLGRGLYTVPGAIESEHRSLLEASKRVPSGVVCLLSALQFHEIGTQMPFEVWMAIGNKDRLPRPERLPLRIVRFSEVSLAHGVVSHRIEGVRVRITSPAKTVVDCFKYRHKIGLEVALEALREGWQDRRFSIDELWAAAHLCRVQSVLRPYLEAIV